MTLKLVDLTSDIVIEIPNIGSVIVGRSYEADVSLDVHIDDKEALKYISKRHCMIDLDDPCVFDLDSTNGTYVNGEKIESSLGSVLKHGDVLRLDRRGFQVLFKNITGVYRKN